MKNYIQKTVKQTNFKSIVLSIAFSLLALMTYGQKQSIFDVMNYQEVLEVTLESFIDELKTNRRMKDEVPGKISFVDANNNQQEYLIKVAQRGHFRRMFCNEMPPLKLNFKKGDLKAAGLSKFDDLKLVTHCIENPKEAKETLLKEYLAYKLYNGITDASYRVQFLKINYVDVHTGEKTKQWGFIIEDTAQLRDRLQASKCEDCEFFDFTKHQEDQFRKAAVFQYLIGNSDWRMTTGQNLKFMEKDGKILTIPYDFDFSGMVDAPYAIPNPNFGLTSIQERIYLGFAEERSNLEPVLNFYAEQQEEILAKVDNFKMLKSRSRKEIKEYLTSFFDNMDNLEISLPKLAAEKMVD